MYLANNETFKIVGNEYYFIPILAVSRQNQFVSIKTFRSSLTKRKRYDMKMEYAERNEDENEVAKSE